MKIFWRQSWSNQFWAKI